MQFPLCSPAEDSQKSMLRGSMQTHTLPALLLRPAITRPVPHHRYSVSSGVSPQSSTRVCPCRMRYNLARPASCQQSWTFFSKMLHQTAFASDVLPHPSPCVSMETALTSAHCCSRGHQQPTLCFGGCRGAGEHLMRTCPRRWALRRLTWRVLVPAALQRTQRICSLCGLLPHPPLSPPQHCGCHPTPFHPQGRGGKRTRQEPRAAKFSHMARSTEGLLAKCLPSLRDQLCGAPATLLDAQPATEMWRTWCSAALPKEPNMSSIKKCCSALGNYNGAQQS